jgi:alpha-galactosidase
MDETATTTTSSVQIEAQMIRSGPTTVAFTGAGSVEFTRELLGDLLAMPELAGLQLRLHDVDAERLATAEGVAHRVAEQARAAPVITATQDRRTAFDGADFVVNMIQVAGLAGTRVDFELPAGFGLRQTIADTIGIGGIFRGLRTFGALAGIAADMAQVCPHAWLLNYTNPMAMNVGYLHAVAPELNVVGLCHSVYWTVVGLCDLIAVPYHEVDYASAGVNHQAWLLRWERQGQNLYPLLDERIAADQQLRRRVRVDLYRRLGYYPTETSEHSSEYLPWYLHHDTEIERLRIPVGDYVGISERNVAEYQATRKALAAGQPLPRHADGGPEGTPEGGPDGTVTEYAPQMIHSIVTGTSRTIYGNLPNTDLIPNLPAGQTVEVPCLVDSLGVRPVRPGPLPPQCAALNRAFLNPVELTVAAAVQGDPRLVRQAAMLDPNTAATLTVEQIWQLCDALVAAHGDLLPEPLRHPCPL